MPNDWVWAVDESGKPCKCYAKPENRGKRNCNHKFHQENGQTKEDFFKEHCIKGYHGDSIFSAKKVEVLPYRMTEEEKKDLLKITSKKDLLVDCDNGAYMELDEALWNDMDVNTFCEKYNFKRDNVYAILHEEVGVILDDREQYRAGDIVPLEDIDRLIDEGFSVDTGVPAMNAVSEQYGFEATKDIYVLPKYMRAGVPDGKGGEINSDETDAYKRIFTTKSYSFKSRQLAYEALINNPDKRSGSVYKRTTLSQRLSGKSGVWRKYITGRTIPYAGRAVITPNTDIAYDEVSIPPRIAADIFRPSITRNLQNKGFSPQQIKEIIHDAKTSRQENVTPITKNLIQSALEEENVRAIINRQPTLHAASMQSMTPKIGSGYTIGINPLICEGPHADFDGDTMAIIGVNSDTISELTDKEMHPSNFKYTPKKQDELMMKPRKDSLFGIMSVLKRRS